MAEKLTIDSLLIIDDTGMPQPPKLRQLMDADVRELYRRDTSETKERYIQECGVIYQCGDPKSHAKQQGLSDSECIKFAIKMYGLPNNYKPDILVKKLIAKYYIENITEAGKAVENLQKSVHNINLAISKYNDFLNEKLISPASIEETQVVINLISQMNKMSGEIPNLVKSLEVAKQNLMYEIQTQNSRGGTQVLSSMDAEEYQDF